MTVLVKTAELCWLGMKNWWHTAENRQFDLCYNALGLGLCIYDMGSVPRDSLTEAARNRMRASSEKQLLSTLYAKMLRMVICEDGLVVVVCFVFDHIR